MTTKVAIPSMTHELLDALNEHEEALNRLAISVCENIEITNAHKGEVAMPFLDSAIEDAFKLGWGAHEKLCYIGAPRKEADRESK